MTWVRVSVVATIPAYHQRSLAELLSGGVVGLGIAEATAAIALLRDDRPGALARLESTAAGGAVRVARAGPGDELAAGRDGRRGGRRGGRGSHGRRRGGGRGRSGRGGGRCSTSGGRRRGLTAELARGVVVRLRVPEATAAVALLGDDGSSALAGLEAAAARGTIDIPGAGAGDKLRARRRTGDVRRSSD